MKKSDEGIDLLKPFLQITLELFVISAQELKENDIMKAVIFNGSKIENEVLNISQEVIETQLKEMGWQVN